MPNKSANYGELFSMEIGGPSLGIRIGKNIHHGRNSIIESNTLAWIHSNILENV